MGERHEALDFGSLVGAIRQVHDQFSAQAGKAVNTAVTLRNWAIGFYIREYEQRGSDRASYGEGLLSRLAEELKQEGLERVDARELRRFRRFYLAHPRIRESLTPDFRRLLPARSAVAIREPAAPGLSLDPKLLISRLSFTHLAELISIDDPLKRAFYEVECVRGNWSVRELRRQIGSLCFERSGLSKDPGRLAALVQAGAEAAEPRLAIRDPYV